MPKLHEIWPGTWLDLRLIFQVNAIDTAVIVLYGVPDRPQRLQRSCGTKEEAARLAAEIVNQIKFLDDLEQLHRAEFGAGATVGQKLEATGAKLVDVPHQSKK